MQLLHATILPAPESSNKRAQASDTGLMERMRLNTSWGAMMRSISYQSQPAHMHKFPGHTAFAQSWQPPENIAADVEVPQVALTADLGWDVA